MEAERPRPFSEHDLVESVQNPGRFGLIDELGGVSVSDYDSEEEREPLPGGLAIVTWDDGAEEQVELAALRLIDRGLAITECAALASDPLGQIGVVERVKVFADIAYHNGDVVKHVSDKRLRWISQFLEGDYVVFDNWIGRVDDVVESITLLFDDGAKCKLRANPETLQSCKAIQRNCEYFPGMKVSVASSDELKSATWLRGSWKRSRKEATILRVEPVTVMVYWIAIGPGPSTPAPSTYQHPRDLVHLPQLSRDRDSWRLGDWSLAPRDEEDGEVEEATVSNPEALPESASQSRKRPAFKRRAVRRKAKKVVAPQYPVRVVRTQSFVDVLWQDGTRSLEIPAVSLDLVAHPGENDFLPEMYVVEGDPGEGAFANDSGRVGIVKSVDAKQRTAKVKWFKRVSSPEEMREFDIEETVSCYGISVIRAYEYALRDLVIRLSPAETQGGNNEDEQMMDDLSWLGSVVGFEDGDISVEWASGDITKVGPNAIFVVDRNDHLEDGDEYDDEEDNTDTDSWETVDSSDSVEQDSIQPEQFSGESQGGLLTLLFTSMSRLVSAIMGRAKKVVAVGERGIEVQEEEMVEADEIYLQTQNADQQSERDSKVDSMECSASSALSLTTIKHFEVAKNPADHHYVNAKNEVPNQRKWLKKVNQEWSILQDNLPDTIYVVMYEDRMDLMRATIVGAAGTPYHDGLFVFDIWLPADYPTIPPVVYYHSGGMRVNPNLYENGKVCLSLLNTWTGKGSELWNPGTSNVLQVLISIQGLVLNAKPYFNEAGYDNQNGTGEGEKNSIAYNENTFLLSCKNILNLLRNPPMHFEDLIKSHFRHRGFKFLSTCKAYLQGVPVARFSDEESQPRENGDESSAGFKLLLRKLVPKLAEAFVAIGAIECREFLEVVEEGA